MLNRFGEFFRDHSSIDALSGDDLARFVVTLKRDHGLGSNTILHNAVIVAQFLKRHGRSGITKEFDLKTFRSTYATGMLRRGFDVRTVQHWMGHKSLETTMRYLAPATDDHDVLNLVTIPSFGKAAPGPRKSAARETRSSRKAAGGRSDAGAEGPVSAGALQQSGT